MKSEETGHAATLKETIDPDVYSEFERLSLKSPILYRVRREWEAGKGSLTDLIMYLVTLSQMLDNLNAIMESEAVSEVKSLLDSDTISETFAIRRQRGLTDLNPRDYAFDKSHYKDWCAIAQRFRLAKELVDSAEAILMLRLGIVSGKPHETICDVLTTLSDARDKFMPVSQWSGGLSDDPSGPSNTTYGPPAILKE